MGGDKWREAGHIVYERRQKISTQPPVCTFFRPSCVQKTRLTNESEVSSPSNRRISAMCGWWCWAS